jgi:hypothetical protein
MEFESSIRKYYDIAAEPMQGRIQLTTGTLISVATFSNVPFTLCKILKMIFLLSLVLKISSHLKKTVVSEENTTEKVNSSPQSTLVIFVPPPLISQISSPIYVPLRMISPLSSPFFGFPPSEEQYSGAGEER